MSIDLRNQLFGKGWVSRGEEEERVDGEYKGILVFPRVSTMSNAKKKIK